MLLLNGMPWKDHVISGAGNPLAEQDKFTALPINISTFSGSKTNCGATRQQYDTPDIGNALKWYYTALIGCVNISDIVLSLIECY